MIQSNITLLSWNHLISFRVLFLFLFIFGLESLNSVDAASGGPDGFGYKWIDSDEAGLSYNFEDISSTGTVSTVSTQDDGVQSVSIGFTFNYYGTAYTNSDISSNGFIGFNGFGGSIAGPASYNDRPIPTAGVPNSMIAGWWDDLDPGQSGTIYHETIGTAPNRRFIVQFQGVPRRNEPANLNTFQFKLFEGANIIEIHYQTLTNTVDTCTIGIENTTGTGGLQYFNANGVPPIGAGPFAISFFIPPVVTNALDSGAGSLRQAIADVIPGETIVFDPALSDQTITLGGSELFINKDLTIDASSLAVGVTVSGNNASRVFHIGNDNVVILDSLTITGGNAAGDFGGGIYNDTGNLTVLNSTITGNTASNGGGVYSGDGDFLEVTTILINCSLTNNNASTSGGGIYNDFDRTVLTHCTITGNTAPAGEGGGIASYGASDTETEVSGTIVSGNSSSDVDLVVTNSFNSFTSSDFNLVGSGDAVGDFNQPGDLIGINDPILAPLGYYGGPTQTMPPRLGSPAIDSGGVPGITTDQRGFPRPVGAASDIGAVEVGPPLPVYEKVHSFTDVKEESSSLNNRGISPTRLVQASDGNFYGTTRGVLSELFSSVDNFGTVFRMSPDGTITTIFDFNFVNGNIPSSLVLGLDGNLYGTTELGGDLNNDGTIFRVTTGGVLTTFHDFDHVDANFNFARESRAGLVQALDGNFYGTTGKGGTFGPGTLFRMDYSGTVTILINFNGVTGPNLGRFPAAELVLGIDGNLYGTTENGGDPTQGGGDGIGTIFKFNPVTEVLTTLVVFNGTSGNKGNRPLSALVQGLDGNFYGTTQEGGASDYGTVFKMTPDGTLTTLVEFDNGVSISGSFPYGLMRALDGNFYGTTSNGGASDVGTAFKMIHDGVATTFETLLEFTGESGDFKGRDPRAAFVQGIDGNFYGTSRFGGVSDSGTVFKMTHDGVATTFETLVEFAGNITEGLRPFAAMMQGLDGNFYGTTKHGGSSNKGTIFKMTPGGEVTTLVEFTNTGGFSLVTGSPVTSGGSLVGPNGVILDNIGAAPEAALVQDVNGNFYGVTSGGGESFRGTVFKMTHDGVTTTFETLVEFELLDGVDSPESTLALGADGNFYGTGGAIYRITPAGTLSIPIASGGGRNALLLGDDDNFYGTTKDGGTSGNGTIFIFNPVSEILTTLDEFDNSNNGAAPHAALIQDIDGNFYGTTTAGGTSGNGTVFKYDPVADSLDALVSFTGTSGSNLGSFHPAFPGAALVHGPDNKFYGTTQTGGTTDNGTVFQISPMGNFTTLVDFDIDPVDSNPIDSMIFGSDGNFYGTTYGNISTGEGSIYRLIFPGTPTIVPLDISSLDITSALLSAKVNARGSLTNVWLDYGTSATSLTNTTLLGFNLTGYQTNLVGTTINNLAEGTLYYYQFRAINADGETSSDVMSFTTLATPTATVGPATNIMRTSARFHGVVNARNLDTTVVFEYGDGVTFPNSAEVTMPANGVVTGSTGVPIHADVATLDPGTTYFYHIVAENSAGTTTSSAIGSEFTTLTDPVATIGGVSLVTSNSVRVEGMVNANNSSTTVVFEYGTDVGFSNPAPAVFGATPSPVSGNTDTSVAANLNLSSFAQGATIYYRIKATSLGGEGISTHNSFTLDNLSGYIQEYPMSPIPDHDGAIIVNITPTEALGVGAKWRFVGEQIWHDSGFMIGGLTTADRTIEFRPVPGFLQPNDLENVAITSGSMETVNANYEVLGAGGDMGQLKVEIQPASIAAIGVPVTTRAQWRILGEDDTQWRDSNFNQTNLVPGIYIVEFKPVAGRTTPRISVAIDDDIPANLSKCITAVYLLDESPSGITPEVIDFGEVTGNTDRPYAWVGQIRSDEGSATGFVVADQVVLTAAHVVFSDSTLEFVTGLNFSFQRDRGTYDPLPHIPNGTFILSGYDDLREDPGTTLGQFDIDSQHLDAAVMYFYDTESSDIIARRGFSGYLASDHDNSNEFLTSDELKILVGYPLEGIPEIEQGRMHATTAMNVNFSYDGVDQKEHVYSTTDINSSGGNSGGPLCVQWNNNDAINPELTYYPAAIFLGGNTSKSVVRSIDSDIIALIDLAIEEIEDPGSTGGGSATVSAQQTDESSNTFRLTIKTNLDASINYQIQDELSTTVLYNGLSDTEVIFGTENTYALSFEEIVGFGNPDSQLVVHSPGEVVTITGHYVQDINAWAELHGLTAGESGLTLDIDGDRIKNLHEYAFNLLPDVADTAQVIPGSGIQGLPYYDVIGSGATRQLTIEYVRRIKFEVDAETGESTGFAPVTLSYHPEFANDPGTALENWDSGVEEPPTPIDDIWERVVVKDPMMGNASRVGRVRVVDATE